MRDAYDDNQVEVGLSLDLIEEEIEAGLPLHADRLVDAFMNEEYYRGLGREYIVKRESEDYLDFVKRPKRTSYLTRKVVNTLTRDLYAPGPTRKVGAGADVDRWLGDVYERNHVNAVLQKADRMATLNGVCALQATGTGRAEKPILLSLWGAHELAWWPQPDDPTEVFAVCTIARERRTHRNTLEERLRFEAWTRDEHRAYLTRWKETPTSCTPAQVYRGLFGVQASFAGPISGEPAGSGRNPYGILPFAFFHDELPVTKFDEGGIGHALRHTNAEIDRELSDLAQVVKTHMAPDMFLVNVSPSWRREKRVGGWQILVPGKDIEGDAAKGEPQALYAQPDLQVEQVWSNIERYSNSTLEELDVPLTAVRVDASTDLSGIAIVAKQLPLLQRTKQRQPTATVAETDLAELVLTLGGNFYDEPRLTEAAADPKFTATWPSPAFPLPTPERDAEDSSDMEAHRKSLIDVVAERQGLTRDQAKQKIKQVVKDEEWLKTILPEDPLMQAYNEQTPAGDAAGGTGGDAAPANTNDAGE